MFGTLFLTNVVTVAVFGFFFVPALDGETLVVAETSPVCATATEASAREAQRGDRRDQVLAQRVSSSGDGNGEDRAEACSPNGRAYPHTR